MVKDRSKAGMPHLERGRRISQSGPVWCGSSWGEGRQCCQSISRHVQLCTCKYLHTPLIISMTRMLYTGSHHRERVDTKNWTPHSNATPCSRCYLQCEQGAQGSGSHLRPGWSILRVAVEGPQVHDGLHPVLGRARIQVSLRQHACSVSLHHSEQVVQGQHVSVKLGSCLMLCASRKFNTAWPGLCAWHLSHAHQP